MKTIQIYGRDKWILFMKGYIEDFIRVREIEIVDKLYKREPFSRKNRGINLFPVRGICDQVSYSNVVYYDENFTRGEY